MKTDTFKNLEQLFSLVSNPCSFLSKEDNLKLQQEQEAFALLHEADQSLILAAKVKELNDQVQITSQPRFLVQ